MVLYQATASVDPASVFFEMANADSVQYRCKNGRIVDVHQDRQIKNCTGGIVWETALLLGTFLEGRVEEYGGIDGLKFCDLDADFPSTPNAKASNPTTGKKRRDRVSSKEAAKELQKPSAPTVLEVGAGCGLLGLITAHLGCSVVLSETAEAMENLHRNVAANRQHVQLPDSQRPLARKVDWTSADDVAAVSACDRAPFDVVLGTDVVFNTNLVEPLLRTLHASSHEGSTVWLCMQERCPDAHKRVLALAPRFFHFADCSAHLAEARGCGAAAELECFLFRLTRKRRLPEESETVA